MPRFRLLSVGFVCLLITSSLDAAFSKFQAFRPATPEELAMKGVESAPGAAAAVLNWVRFDDDTNSSSAEYMRIKVFAEEGRKYADVEIPYVAGYPISGRVVDIAARTLQPDGTIVPFDGKVYDKVLYKSGGVRLRAKTFSLAGVQPGSILEYRFQRRWRDALLLNTSWNFQLDIPILHARMTLRPYDSGGEYGTFFTYFNMPPGKVPVKNRTEYDLELENIPAFVSESLAPPRELLSSRVNFYYTADRIKPDQFWDVQGKSWIKEIEGFIGKSDRLRPTVATLAGTSALETAKNVYAKAQTFKNLSFEDEPEARDKKSAFDVVTKGEGYRREIARAFVAMARAAGLEAHVYRVAPRNERFFSAKIPDAEQMSGEIAAVMIDGKPLFLDPGTPTAPFGVISWERSTVPGMRIARGEPVELLNVVAPQVPDDAMIRRSADLKLNGELLEGSVTATFSGQEALVRRLRSWGDDEVARTKAFEDEAKTWFPSGATVKLEELTGTTSHAEPVVAKFAVTLPGVVSSAGSRTVLPMSVFTVSATNPFAPVTRTHMIYYPYPSIENDVVRVVLPDELSPAALPPPVTMNAGAFLYSNETKKDGAALQHERSMTVSVMIIELKNYEALRGFYSTVATEDQKPLVLVTK